MQFRSAWDRIKKTRFIRRHFANAEEILSAIERGEKPEAWVLRDGTKLYTTGEPTGLVKEIVVRGVYSPPGLAVEPGDVVVDVGANIGVFSIEAVRRGAAVVHACEPGPETAEFLKRNAKENRLPQIVAHWTAVADRTGSLDLYLGPGRCSGGSRVFPTGLKPDAETVKVPAVSLTELLEQNGLERVDFLKLDCEGAEGLILSSTPAGVLRRISRICMEFHDQLSPVKHPELRRLLDAAGFTTQLKWNGRSRTGYIYAARAA